MSHSDHGELMDTSPPRESSDLMATSSDVVTPVKRSKAQIEPSESEEGLVTEQMIGGEIQNRLAANMQKCLADFSEKLQLQIGIDKQTDRDIANRGYTDISTRLSDLTTSRNSLSVEYGHLKVCLSESIATLTQSHDRQESVIPHQQFINDALATRISPCGNPYNALWNLPGPTTIPVMPESRNTIPAGGTSHAPSSMSMQTPPGNIPESQNVYFSNPAHVSDHGGGRPANDARRPLDSTQLQRELRLHKLKPPPKFDNKNLNWRMRNMRYWRELYSTIEDSQVLASVGLSASDDLKDILMDFFDDTQNHTAARAFESFLIRAQKEFGSIQEVERMDRLCELMSFKRKGDMSVRKFWQITKRLLLYAKQNNVVAPEDIMFAQILSAMSLSSAQRRLVLAHFESTRTPNDILNLQNISLQLFADSYNSIPASAYCESDGEE